VSADPDQYTEVLTTEKDLQADVSGGLTISAIVNLFKGGITYGRKGVIQREQQVKTSYVQKLRRVLFAICRDAPIPSFTTDMSPTNSVYFRHQGRFRVVSPLQHKPASEEIVSIKATVGGHTLFLDCSLRYFSEGNEPDGTFQIHSGNYRFFNGQIDLFLDTVFILLDRRGNDYFGTPLYLRLSIEESQNKEIETSL
jgi:hypothetical protein